MFSCFHAVSNGNTASGVDGNCGQTVCECYTFIIIFLENEKLVLKIFMTQALFFLLNLFLSRRLIAKNNNNNLKSITKQRDTRRQNLHGKAFTLHPMQSTQDHPASSSHIFQTCLKFRISEFPLFVISPGNCWPGSFKHLSDLGRGGSDN